MENLHGYREPFFTVVDNDLTMQDRLIKTPLTRNEDHFVRNHGGIPTCKEDDYFLDIGGMVNEPKRLTMKELKDESIFPRQSNIVTLQCSGTRRVEQINEYPGDGDELINAPVSALSLVPSKLMTSTVGRGSHWDRQMDRSKPQKGHQVLWRYEGRRKTH